MKKAITIAAAVILILLVIPIPTGVYKDGGTRTYTALTYKIVAWNHMYEEGIYKKTKVYPFPMNFWSLDRLAERERPNMEKELGQNNIGEDPDTTSPEVFPVSFEAQYIRTDGYHEGQIYPQVRVIRSVRELQAYYEANQDRYNLERREDPASDSTIGFLNACDRYDETYFEDRVLVMVLLEEGSGSVRHWIEKVLLTEDGGKPALVVDIEVLVPEICTCDMAEWHILIEPEAGVDVEEENITVLYGGRKLGNLYGE